MTPSLTPFPAYLIFVVLRLLMILLSSHTIFRLFIPRFPSFPLSLLFPVWGSIKISPLSSLLHIPPSKHPLIRLGLVQSPWPDLPLRERGTHLGIIIGRDVTLEEIWAGPVSKALSKIKASYPLIKSLSLPNRIIYVNVFIVSLFSYIGLFFVLPADIWPVIKNAISKLITPLMVEHFPLNLWFAPTSSLASSPPLRISVKDIWAFVNSLLAARSPFISSSSNYFDLPSIDPSFTKLISLHRDAAAIDYWRSKHLPDGTLTPPAKMGSSSLYKVFISDTYLDIASSHLSSKIHRFISSSPSNPLPPPSTWLNSLSSSMLSCPAPNFLRFHQFSLINNALPSSRRMRHQNKIAISNIPPCFFCVVKTRNLWSIFSLLVLLFPLLVSPFFLLS